MDKKMKGQSSIWVVLAIIIAASIVFLFIYLRNPDIEDKDYAEFNPETYLEECMQDVALDILPNVQADDDPELVISFIKDAVALRVPECFDRMEDEYRGGNLEADNCA